ncbi:hypothetical protein FA13DRAFT_1715045 [Coprinellus micaceus]|uniref:Uncharacterized protein n=1 Tax=Coprinellus micaceus TaxID=71717 RepID=A0A4Y7SQ32_COPMI|nr:hypothetical protein FA13DRAFT_1715045 [Coprinellus micaceus]
MSTILPSTCALPMTHSSNEPSLTWHDLENVLFRSGVSAVRSGATLGPASVVGTPEENLRLLALSYLLTINQDQVKEEVGELMDDFDEAWLAVQRAATLFIAIPQPLRGEPVPSVPLRPSVTPSTSGCANA